MEHCRHGDTNRRRRGGLGVRQRRKDGVLQLQRLMGGVGRGLVRKNCHQVAQYIRNGFVPGLFIVAGQVLNILLQAVDQLHQPSAQLQRPAGQRQDTGKQQPTYLFHMGPALFGVRYRLPVSQGNQSLCRAVEHQGAGALRAQLLVQLRRRRFVIHAELIARQKATDMRFIEAAVGVDRLACRSDPGQHAVL